MENKLEDVQGVDDFIAKGFAGPGIQGLLDRPKVNNTPVTEEDIKEMFSLMEKHERKPAYLFIGSAKTKQGLIDMGFDYKLVRILNPWANSYFDWVYEGRPKLPRKKKKLLMGTKSRR